MTHILTGEKFSCLNMTQKLNNIINERQTNQLGEEEDKDTITLKSIKRW